MDAAAVAATLPRICSLMPRVVGMPSQVGCCRFVESMIVSATTRTGGAGGGAFQPFARKLLKACNRYCLLSPFLLSVCPQLTW